ncbi:MAG: NAD(P)-dependent dehydrogenase (short-subunit alcohol dehydrogenase family) [Halioglobus sp.]|jgi:NAD(P)-dependent dehydrogenase (short-subunit alcohol dehydrogenase family)
MQISKIPSSYQTKDNVLRGKIIMVTGAGDGIGRTAALHYAGHGASVILLGRTVEKLEAVYDEILAAGGPEPAISVLDLATAGSADGSACAESVASEFPHLDGLLHNASILGDLKPIENASFEVWCDVMQVNVNSHFLLSHHLLPLLKAAPASSIVFTTSSVGRVGKAFWGAYAASKFATEGLMQVLAAELENTSAVRVNSLNPGATRTAMRRTAYPGESPSEVTAAEEIMDTYLYLMSEDSVGVTGQTFDAQ